jgi:hypothetical protein
MKRLILHPLLQGSVVPHTFFVYVCFILPLITTNLSIELPAFFPIIAYLTCNGDELDTYPSTLATLTHVCQTINGCALKSYFVSKCLVGKVFFHIFLWVIAT